MSKRDGRPTIIDVARRAGVSFKTVSRVLNGNPRVAADLQDRVRRAASDLNYQPNLAARSLASPRSYTLALLFALPLKDMQREDELYFPSFYSDLQFAAMLASQKAGYRLTIEICDTSDDAPPAFLPSGVTSSNLDGIIVSPPLCDHVEMIEVLGKSGIPHVLIAPGLNIENGLSVATDEYGGAAAMTEYLLALGHRRIAYVNGPDGHFAAAARMKAYCDVLAAFEPNIDPIIEKGAFTYASGYRAAEALLSMPVPPTAIFCANDDMASGAIAAATRLGVRVPDQLSVAGFDDSAMARITSPQLTTVRQPFGAMTTEAERLLSDMQSASTPQHVVLPAKVIERGSTAPIKS